MAHGMREFETVHRTRHVNIGKDHPDVVAGLQNAYGLIGVRGFDNLKPGILNGFDRA